MNMGYVFIFICIFLKGEEILSQRSQESEEEDGEDGLQEGQNVEEEVPAFCFLFCRGGSFCEFFFFVCTCLLMFGFLSPFHETGKQC